MRPLSSIGYRIWRLSAVGVLCATLLFAASLTPSLVPRGPVLQGALSGVAAGIGYAVGAVLLWLWRLMLLPETKWRPARIATFLAALAIAVTALGYSSDWQNATRAAMSQPPVETVHAIIVALIAAIVFLILFGIFSLIVAMARLAGRALSRALPGRAGPVLGALAAVWLFAAIVDGLIIRRALEMADAAFAAGELLIDPRFERPDDPMMTGSAASLIDWEELGNRGRDFVGRTPSAEEIATFSGSAAMTPVRVYVGRISAGTARERAELALEELIRVGGFEREILIVTTPVGTGWMDPGSHDAIDFMFGGDTAHVGVQYSYLTSVLSILTNIEYGFEQSRELFDVVYDHWASLPNETRPKLYIHGLSQGALNSQATVPFLDVLEDTPAGALWVGSPFISPIWSHVRNRRNAGSPAWLPTFGNGSLVRVTTQENILDQTDAPWGPMRFVFLHYPSDPLVVFEWSILWERPDWLKGRRPPDIAPEMRWYPVVTGLQLGLDMMHPLGVEGYGHFYIARDYIDAWAAVSDPPGWSPERAAELEALFETRPAPW